MGFSAAAAAISAYSAYDSHTRGVAAEDAAEKNAKQTADASDEANNKVNQKTPDTNALLAANQAAGKNGPSGTMLTGASGVDPSLLQLGKSTLLGS